MLKHIAALVGIGGLCVACSSSDEGVGAGGSSGGSGGTAGGRGGTNGTGARAGTAAGASSGAGGLDASASGGGAGTSAGGATDAASSGSIAALCTAAAAAKCRKGPQSTADCITHFQPIATCGVVRSCVACAGAAPTVTCTSDGSPDVVGCESVCNIDQCKDAGVSDSGRTPTGCGGADFITQPQGAQSPMVIAYSGGPIELFGPVESDGRHGELGGRFEVTGLPPGARVVAKLVEFPCDRTGCPMDLSFVFDQSNGGLITIGSSDAGCGAANVFASSNGQLTFGVGKVGSGPEEHNLGIMLFVDQTDGGASDGH